MANFCANNVIQLCVCGTRVPQNLSKKCKSISHLTALCTVCVKGQRRRRYDGSRIATCCLSVLEGFESCTSSTPRQATFYPLFILLLLHLRVPSGLDNKKWNVQAQIVEFCVFVVPLVSLRFAFGGLCQHIKSKIASSLLRKLRSERGRIVNMISVSFNGIAIWHLHLPMQQ